MSKKDNVLIKKSLNLKEVRENFALKSADKIHILSDFDRTLTYSKVNGKEKPSIIAHLRDENYLSKEYSKKAKKLFEKYHPIEIDPEISKDKKREVMKKWWSEHYALMIKSGLDYETIKKASSELEIKLRKGVDDFLKKTRKYGIEVVILSATGIAQMIELFLGNQKLLLDNIHIIGNYLEFDKNGKAVGIKKPIIHNANKGEIAVKNYPVWSKIKAKKNVILLGDSLEDSNMIDGFDYDNLLRIGFYNYKDDSSKLEAYKQKYDVLILNDGDFDFVNEVLS